MTVREVAFRLGCHEQTVLAAIRSGQIKATGGGRGRQWLIEPNQADRLKGLMAERKPGRPRKAPPSVAEIEGWALYRAEVAQITEKDYRLKIEALCRAYRDLEPAIQSYLAAPNDPSLMAKFDLGPLHRAVESALIPFEWPGLSLSPDLNKHRQLVAEVHRLRLSGFSFPQIAERIHKSVKWAQELEKQWQERYGHLKEDQS